MKTFTKPFILGIALILALSSFAAQGQGRSGGTMRSLKTKKEAESVPKEAVVAMACSKCQTILVKDNDDKKGFLSWFTADTEHACPGCKGKIKFRRRADGKSTRRTYVHTCSNCGDESAFCCTTPGKMTKGMEEKATKGDGKKPKS